MKYALLGLGYVVVLGLLAAGLLVARDRISRAIWSSRNPPEKLAALRRDFENRLSKPDWTFYEAHLGRHVPDALREVYSNRELLHTRNFTFGGLSVSGFQPIDRQALVDARKWLAFDAVPFASSDADMIYLRPGAQECDAVYITYHDGGDTEQLAPDVTTFISGLRRVLARHRLTPC
jgi:hypothetical protein